MFNFKDEIKTIEIHVLSYESTEAQDYRSSKKSFAISKLTIFEMRSEKNSLLEQLRSKKVVGLPVNSFFNVANCDFVHFNGAKTFMQNYNYLFDYDINIDFSGRQTLLKGMGIKTPSSVVDVHIDRQQSFFGCSSLRTSAILDHKTVS